ncbi:MAG: SRPBCC family protein [Deltaproteobacteria bacterium]|nr:SRPBCC family protein [Deltaproteobacteria bacterium]
MLVATLALALAGDATKPHEHTGIVSAYKGAPPAVTLSSGDIARIEAGEVVLKQQQVGSGGRGIAIFDIAATPSKIWSRIVDYSAYPRMVDKVAECGNYKVSGSEIYTRFLLAVMGFDVEYFIHHTYRPDQGYLTWTLDYSRQSDLDDSVGYWRVTALESSPPQSRLEYSVDIRFKGYIPGFVQDMISKKGLTDAATWVKRESEK